MSAAPSFAQWQPHDFAFTATSSVANPFVVPFTATIKDPAGKIFTQLGFYDGNNTWKVRVSTGVTGQWSLVTQSELPELNAQSVAFTSGANTNSRVHGALRVDAKNPHHFVYEDGTRFFLMGYECDWLWALDAGDARLPVMGPFLDKLAASGFNYMVLAAYSHDTKWRAGKTAADDFGPPPFFPWLGTPGQPDHQRFNLAFWQQYDRMMQALLERGFQTHIFLKVYNKMVTWPAKGSAEDDLYFRWMIARYAAYPNVIWDFAKEAHREKSPEYKTNRLAFIRSQDAYHRLLTVHDDDALNDAGTYDTFTDFRADQKHTNFYSTVIKQRARRAWPVANLEFGYESGPGGPDDRTSSRAQWPDDVVSRAWEVALAGGYPAYYYTYTAWDIIRPQDTPKGHAYFKTLRDFFEQTRYWELSPAPKITTAGLALANPGKEYVVFLKTNQPFTLTLTGAAPLKGEWLHPLTNQRLAASQLKSGANELHPPDAWKEMAVLHVTAER